jgi:hypothetical protein
VSEKGHRQVDERGTAVGWRRRVVPWRSGSRRQTGPGGLGPWCEGLGAGGAIFGGGEAVAGEVKEVGDRVVDGQEALNLAGRFEAFHLPLSSAGRLMRVLSSVVQPFMLAMLGDKLQIFLGRAVRP